MAHAASPQALHKDQSSLRRALGLVTLKETELAVTDVVATAEAVAMIAAGAAVAAAADGGPAAASGL